MYSNEQDVLMVGKWRNGLSEKTRTYVDEVDARVLNGTYRDFPYESTVAALINLLDSYDQYAEIAAE